MSRLLEEVQTADRERATWSARVEALEMSLVRKDGVGALLAADQVGTLGSLAALLSIDAGYEDAIAAVLGRPRTRWRSRAWKRRSTRCVTFVRRMRAARASWWVGPPGGRRRAPPCRGLPDGAAWATEVVTPAKSVAAAVELLLEGVVVVEDLAQARALVAAAPRVTAVTTGVTCSGRTVRGEVRRRRRASCTCSRRSKRLRRPATRPSRAGADPVRPRQRARGGRGAQERHDATLERLNESDAALAAVAEQLGHLGATARAAAAESARVRASLERALATLSTEQGRLRGSSHATRRPSRPRSRPRSRSLRRRRTGTARTRSRPRPALPRPRRGSPCGPARSAPGPGGPRPVLARAAATERAARERAAAREAVRVRQALRAEAVRDGALAALAALDRSLERAGNERDAAEAARGELDVAVTARRSEVDALGTQLRELTDVAHRDEVARTQQQLRIEQLQGRSVDELGLDPEVLLDEFGPDRPVPVLAEDGSVREDEEGGR
ncbi:hypothetical protein NKG05_01410 [Oerskovia sp. M15]